MLYLCPNFAFPTTSPPVPVAVGTAGVKTMLQIKPFNLAKIVEWGYCFDGNVANVPGTVELCEVDVAATVVAYVDADITKYNGVADVAVPSVAGLTLGTAASGYTASAEGTVAAYRNLDPAGLLAPPTGPFIHQFPLGKEPMIQIGKFMRIRTKFASAVNMFCYVLLDI